MTELVPVVPAMFDAIHDHLLRPLNPRFTPEMWRLLFHRPWTSREPMLGFALLDKDRPVGFASYLCSDQEIEGRAVTVCNFNTWVVDPPYRAQAMSLAMPAVKRRDMVFTNLTALPEVHQIFSRLGYRELDSRVRMHWPFPALPERGVRVRFGDAIPQSLLSPADQELHRAHAGLPHLLAVLVETPEGACYVRYSLKRWRRIPEARLQHVSPRTGLAGGMRALQWALFRRHGRVVVSHDSRLVADAPGPFTDRRMPVARLVGGARVVTESLSNAYSEIALYNI